MADSDWEVVKEQPSSDQWEVVKEEPQAATLAKISSAIGYPLRSTAGVQRAGELAKEGAQSVVQGIKGMADKNPYNYWYREPLANVVGGLGQIVSSPAGLVSPYLEKIGIPKEASEFALPFMIPGAKAGAAKVGELADMLPKRIPIPAAADIRAAAGAIRGERGRFIKPGNPANYKAAKKLDLIADIKERAERAPSADRDRVLRNEFSKIIEDPEQKRMFDDAQIDQMSRIVKGTAVGNSARWIEDVFGKDSTLVHLLGFGVGHLPGLAITAGTGVAGRAIRGLSTGRQVRKLESQIANDPILSSSEDRTIGLGAVESLARDVIRRGRSGRPIETAPLPIGSEQDILRKISLAVQPKFRGNQTTGPLAGVRTDPSKMQRLEEMVTSGQSYGQIAKEFDISRSAVAGLIDRLGLTGKSHNKFGGPQNLKATSNRQPSMPDLNKHPEVSEEDYQYGKQFFEHANVNTPVQFDRIAMRRSILDRGGLPQAEVDHIVELAVRAIKKWGSAQAAAVNTKLRNPVWDRAYQAALRGAIE